MAGEAGLAVDEAGFRALMLEQRQRAQKDAKAKKSGHADLSVFHELLAKGETVFTGYTELEGAGPRALHPLQRGTRAPSPPRAREISLVLDADTRSTPKRAARPPTPA